MITQDTAKLKVLIKIFTIFHISVKNEEVQDVTLNNINQRILLAQTFTECGHVI